MTAYYNENDPYAAEWLRNLIAAGHIAPGIVDERDIREVEAFELFEFTQCHFFAGIGIWSHALRRAGWSDDRPIWTGSCPCQPFSAAGQQKGFSDDRHLWPVWFDLIRECRPPVVLGEQVASALDWLDLVSADLEATDYAFGASDLCAAGFDGAHIRQRLYFVGMANASGGRQPVAWRREAGLRWKGEAGGVGAPVGLAESGCEGRQQVGSHTGGRGEGSRAQGLDERSGNCGPIGGTNAPLLGRNPVDWLFCRDGKWRPVEPGVQQVVDETALIVGRMRPGHEAQVEEIVNETALRFSTTRDEILRAVRRGTAAANVRQRADGDAFCTSEAQILLAALRELDREEGEQSNAENGSSALRCVEAELRMLWRERALGDPSRQRELARRLALEFADALRTLPSTMARTAQEAGYPVLYADAPASFPLSDGGSDAHKNRVGKLRAYGNGLDAETATQFCAAVREIVEGL